MITIPSSYMEDEVRDGFPVPTSIKRAWAVQLQILDKVDAICKKYNIPYYAESGTLLGVVRHGGYIPWDDDLDIVMKRHDYERFLSVAGKELPEGYSLLNIYNEEGYDNFLTRIVNSKVINKSDKFLNDNCGCPYVMGIDLFVMDYLAPTEELLEEQKSIAKQIASYIKSVEKSSAQEKLNIKEYAKEVASRYGITLLTDRSLSSQLYNLMDQVMSLYSKDYEDPNVKYMGLTPLWLDHQGSVYPKEYFSESVWMDFEITSVPVPVYYDAILSKKYGEYMRLIRQGSLHGYPFFADQIKTLEDTWGISKYDYQPGSEKEVLSKSRIVERSQKKATVKHREEVKQEYNTYTNILSQAYDSFIELFEKGQFDMALSLLEKCQEVAIALGNSIEKRYGEGQTTVSIIEGYCESVYQLYGSITGGDDEGINKFFSDMASFTNAIEESIEKDIIAKKIVAILPYRYAYWSQLEEMYRKETAREDTEVYVIPLPFFERSMTGNIDDINNVICDIKEFPDDVKTYHYENIKLDLLHPDVIIFQNPYDNYSSVTTVNPYFYSSRLYNYTEELVFIPPFIITDFGEEDNRAHRNIKDLIYKPGLIYADRVLIDSSKMREIYIDKLTTFVGDDTKEVWEDKIVLVDKPTDISVEDYFGKKIILYYVSGSKLIISGQSGIEKIRRSIHIFNDNKDKLYIKWYFSKLDEEILRQTNLLLFEQFTEVLEEFVSLNIGKVIISDSVEESRNSQAFYGDPGRIVTPMIVNSRPVMLQNVDI